MARKHESIQDNTGFSWWLYGGLGSAVAEVVCTTLPVPMRILGVPGVFAPTGSVGWLLEHFNLTPSGIRDAAFELVEARLAA